TLLDGPGFCKAGVRKENRPPDPFLLEILPIMRWYILPVSENYAAEVRDFFDFLDEHKPAHFVSSSLTTILRTDPPVTFGPTGVADMVAGWAEERAGRTGERLSDLLLAATRAIVDAYNIDAIAHFRPRDFYRPYRARLIALCPEREGMVLEAALDAL